MTATRSTLVCASANPDKVAEIEALLAGAVELLPRPASMPDVVEDADTLVGNARLKAVAIVRRDRTRRRSPTTPDSRSTPSTARPASTPGGTPDPTARTPTTATSCSARSAGSTTGGPGSARSRWCAGRTGASWRSRACARASISVGERGSGGWGYDSVFVPADGDGRTFAEMTDAEKHAMSHRGRAFRALVAALTAP